MTDPTRVVATGTFELLHPGHVHYLEEAAGMGTELHVVVSRGQRVSHKPTPVVPDEQRRDLVGALEVVDHARLGHPEDVSVPIREIDPDVLVLGHDQHHDEADVERLLERAGVDCRIERASGLEPEDDRLYASSAIKERVQERRRPRPTIGPSP